MEEKDFRDLAVNAVMNYYNSQAQSGDENGRVTEDDVFIVWECKTLQNNKAMLSTTAKDGLYFEFTWNGDKREGYLDVYDKWKNMVITEMAE